MATIAVGGEADCYDPIPGQAFVHEAAVGRFEANASRNAMLVTAGVSELVLRFPAAQTAFWTHFTLYHENAPGAAADYILWETASGTEAPYKIEFNADGTWTFKRFKTGAFVTIGSTASAVISNALATFDIQIVKNATTGIFNVFKDGSNIFSFSGNTDTDNNPARLHLKGLTGSTNEANFSQVAVADESTLGWKVVTLFPDGNGANTAWTNDYTTIDEAVYDDSDFIETNGLNQIETNTASNINGAFSTYNVRSVTVAARASNDSGSAVNDFQHAVRVAGINYFSPNAGLTKDGNQYSRQYVWNTNPNTLGNWTQTDVNAMEIGVKSV